MVMSLPSNLPKTIALTAHLRVLAISAPASCLRPTKACPSASWRASRKTSWRESGKQLWLWSKPEGCQGRCFDQHVRTCWRHCRGRPTSAKSGGKLRSEAGETSFGRLGCFLPLFPSGRLLYYE